MALDLAAFTDEINAGILDPTGIVSNFYSGGDGWSDTGLHFYVDKSISPTLW